MVGAGSGNETMIVTMVKFPLTAIQTLRLFNVSHDVRHFPAALMHLRRRITRWDR